MRIATTDRRRIQFIQQRFFSRIFTKASLSVFKRFLAHTLSIPSQFLHNYSSWLKFFAIVQPPGIFFFFPISLLSRPSVQHVDLVQTFQNWQWDIGYQGTRRPAQARSNRLVLCKSTSNLYNVIAQGSLGPSTTATAWSTT